MITAIVLVHTAADRIPETAQAIADLDGVSEVYSCAGDVDLIAIVRVNAHEELAEVIAGRLSKVAGRAAHRHAHRVPLVRQGRHRRHVLRRPDLTLARRSRTPRRARAHCAAVGVGNTRCASATPDAASRVESATQRSSTSRAAPVSIAAAARLSAAGNASASGPGPAPIPSAATSAPAALSSTASRTGPCSPASTAAERGRVDLAGAAPQVVAGRRRARRARPGRASRPAPRRRRPPRRCSCRWSSARRGRRRRAPPAPTRRGRRTPPRAPARGAGRRTRPGPRSGWAGLVSGPSTFIAVGMPSSRRGTEVCRIDGW